jgi:hypothetical protein
MFNLRRRRGRPLTMAGSKHIGQVVNNNPTGNPNTKGAEFVTIRITGIHDGVPDSDLPMFSPVRGGQPNAGTMGSIGPIPPIGSTVIVSYDGGDEAGYNGNYVGTPGNQMQQVKEFTGGDTTGKNYPNVHATIDQSGNRTTHDHTRNLHTFEHNTGMQFSVDGMGHVALRQASTKQSPGATQVHSNGLTLELQGAISLNSVISVTLASKGKIQLISGGDMEIGAKGNITLAAGGNIMMKQPIITNPGVPAVPQPTAPTTRSIPQASAPADPTAGSNSQAGS